MIYNILKDNKQINQIVANDEEFVIGYCKQNGYTYEEYIHPYIEPEEYIPEPTQLDKIEAQATYTAMLTDTLLEVEE